MAESISACFACSPRDVVGVFKGWSDDFIATPKVNHMID
jgi:hypothetical protein